MDDRGIETVAAELRLLGQPWVQIATRLREQFGLNALTSLRLAHGCSRERAAAEWNRR